MTMLTVSVVVAALVSLAAMKFAADAARAKTALAVAKSKRQLQRVLPALAAFALVALGAAYTYTSA
jgi:hypothetical protein